MNEYFATVARGLEPLAADELEQLGARQIELGFCGVSFSGDQALLYRVNLWARLPFRILWKLKTFDCRDAEELYRNIQQIDWSNFLTPEMTLAVKVTGKTPQLNHTHFTALQAKNAIVQQQEKQFQARSFINPKAPDLQVNLHLDAMHCTVSLDSSGDSLHRRGYRPAVGLAPLKESLAAALIQLSDWQPEQMFYDPLCGSGTLPLEAGLMALNIAPGLFREKFGFESWRDFDRDLWQHLRQTAKAEQKSALSAPIWGSDRDETVIDQAQVNANRCGLGEQVYFLVAELEEIAPPVDHGIIFCNPPYGERLDALSDLGQFYHRFGQILKDRFRGWTAYVLSGNKELSQTIGLKSAKRFAVFNGSIPCQLLKYELY